MGGVEKRLWKVNSFLFKSSAVFGIRVVSILLTLTATTILARSFGPTGYGQYAFLLALVTILALPAQLGLPQLIVRETAKAEVEGNIDSVRALWRWAYIFVATTSLLLILTVVFYFDSIGRQRLPQATLVLALLLIPLLSLGNISGAILRGLGYVVLGQLPENVIRPALFAAGLAIFSIWFTEDLTLSNAFLIQGSAAFVGFVLGILIQNKNAPKRGLSNPKSQNSWKGWAISTISFGLISGLLVINGSVDVLMLGYLRTDGEIGVYKIAATVAGLITFGLQTMNMIIMPYISRHHALGDLQALQKLVTITARIILALAVGAGLVVIIFGKQILGFAFGPEFVVGYLPLVILAGGQFANAAFGSAGVLLSMSGHEKEVLKSVALASVANIVLNIILIPRYGMSGAAIATAVSIFAMNAAQFIRVWKVLGINSTAILIWQVRE